MENNIKLEELETNLKNENKITCPKCNNDVIIKKQYSVDIPRALGFMFFLGASFAVVVLINGIVILRQRYRTKTLPKEIKDKLQDDKMSIMGMHVPQKTRIACSKCNYSFYENYDTGDLILVVIFFVIIFLTVILTMFCLFKK